MALPWLVGLPAAPISPGFWGNMSFCALLAVTGNLCLVQALRTTDLSIVGPINAYKSVVGLVLGIFLLGEIPTTAGFFGVGLIVVGSFIVADRIAGEGGLVRHRNAFLQFFSHRGVQWRFAALVLSAVEAVFLKRALLASSPLFTFLLWCLLGALIAAVAVVGLLKSRVRSEWQTFRRRRGTYGWLAFTTGLMQLSTLLSFGKLQVGYSLALFQTSTLLSVFFGYQFFQEKNFARRLWGSLVMVLGASCIVVFGQRR